MTYQEQIESLPPNSKERYEVALLAIRELCFITSSRAITQELVDSALGDKHVPENKKPK